MQVLGPNELLEDVLRKGFCVSCGACVHLCPYFRAHRGRIAMPFSCDRETGRCHAFCPKTEVDLEELSRAVRGSAYSGEPAGQYRELFMARASDAAGRGEFQDGGTVSALISYALDADWIDSAVLTGRQGLVPVPGLATSSREVAEFATSKYTAAPTLSSLNEGASRGFSRMGVVGTPCQNTAVAQMRSNPMQREDFSDPVALSVGLFCTWALDTRGLLAFIQERAPGQRIHKMRIPPPPAGILEVDTDGGTLEIPLDEIRSLVPEGCRICPDMTSEWADISVGAMEGYEGYNTLIARSDKGQRLIRDAASAGYLVLEDFPSKSLKHLLQAAADKKRRAFRLASSKGLLNNEEGRAALRVSPQALEQILAEEGGSE